MIITPDQIRAARAYLDWSTADLAEQTGLTVNGINKIERGHVTPQKETLIAIQRVYEEAGLEFLPFCGVRKKDQIVQILDEDNAYGQLLDDIVSTLRDIGGEICVSGVVETAFAKNIGTEKLNQYSASLARYGITQRLLIEEGDTSIVMHHDYYHVVPSKYFYPEPFCIYGSKLALVCLGVTTKVIIIDNVRMTESVQKLFDYVWDHTKSLTMYLRDTAGASTTRI